MWVENSLGDRVEATYTINVIENPVSFTLTKELTEAASTDETFVFKVTDEDNNSFYVTLTVAKGATSASINVVDLAPGEYTVTELSTNWRYSSADSSTTQTNTLDDADTTYSFTFTNTKTNNYWVSDSAKVTNKMQSSSE